MILWLRILILIILIGLFARSESFAGAPACDATPALKMHACEIEMKTLDCESLGSEGLRDCRQEAYHPQLLPVKNAIRAGYCVVGLYNMTIGALFDLMTGAAEQNEFQARYYSPEVQKACVEHEDAGDLAVARKCKHRLIDDFPDLSAKYSPNLDKVRYLDILKAVHRRLDEIQGRQPSLVKFMDEHPHDTTQALEREAEAQLQTWHLKLQCYSPAAQAELACASVFAVLGIADGAFEGMAGKLLKNAREVAQVKYVRAGIKSEVSKNFVVPRLCPDCPELKLNADAKLHGTEHQISSSDFDQIMNGKNLSEDERKALIKKILPLSRDYKETTMFPPDLQIEDILKAVKPGQLKETSGAAEGNRVLRGRVEVPGNPPKSYDVNVVFCGQPTCKNGAHEGDVITVYPQCGPDVIKIPRTSTLNGYLEGDRTWAAMRVGQIPCK